VGTIITKAGTEEHRPQTDEEWQAVRNAALQDGKGDPVIEAYERICVEGNGPHGGVAPGSR
jgi:hypothetical protein